MKILVVCNDYVQAYIEMFVSKYFSEVVFFGGVGTHRSKPSARILPECRTKERRSGFKENIYHKRFEPVTLRHTRLKIVVVVVYFVEK